MKKVSQEVTLEGIKEVIASEVKNLSLEIKDVAAEVKILREDMNSKFKEVNTKIDDVVIHALDMKRTLNSHTEMIGNLGLDLEEVKIGRSYAKK